MGRTIRLALLSSILITGAQAANPVEFDLIVREVIKKGASLPVQSLGEQPGPHPTTCKTIDVDTGAEEHSVWVNFIGDEVQDLTFTSESRHGYVIDRLDFNSDADGALQSATTAFGTRDAKGMTYLRQSEFQALLVESKETKASFQKELTFWRAWLRRQ